MRVGPKQHNQHNYPIQSRMPKTYSNPRGFTHKYFCVQKPESWSFRVCDLKLAPSDDSSQSKFMSLTNFKALNLQPLGHLLEISQFRHRDRRLLG
jgi:hypothetical protein